MPKMTSAMMKKHLSEQKPVRLADGSSVNIQASGIIWRGKHITDIKDVPSDEEIKAADDAHIITIATRK